MAGICFINWKSKAEFYAGSKGLFFEYSILIEVFVLTTLKKAHLLMHAVKGYF